MDILELRIGDKVKLKPDAFSLLCIRILDLFPDSEIVNKFEIEAISGWRVTLRSHHPYGVTYQNIVSLLPYHDIYGVAYKLELSEEETDILLTLNK